MNKNKIWNVISTICGGVFILLAIFIACDVTELNKFNQVFYTLIIGGALLMSELDVKGDKDE